MPPEVAPPARRRKKRKRRNLALPAARPRLGVLLRFVALALALVAAGALIWDIVAPAPANAPGVRLGGILGTAIRTAIVGSLALYAFQRSHAYSDPKRFSEPALGRSRLVEIAASLRDFHVGDTSAEFTPYRELTDAQLASVYETIERERAPHRFDALVLEIRRRVQSTA